MTPSSVATLIKDSVDILDVVGQVVALRRRGHRHVGLCPFHQEKTPSFSVDPDKGLFYCFGCGTGGDVIKFTMLHGNLSFAEAVRHLAQRYHVPLPEVTAESTQKRDRRKELYQVVDAACDFFYRRLHHSAEGQKAKRYAVERGLDDSLLEEQKLGYAPNGWHHLLDHLQSKGFSRETGLAAGLLAQSQGGRVYDRFRDRLIFPISDPQGRMVAFGGRSLDGSEPKYLNSPETPIYHKGRTLYGLATARRACRDRRQVVLVEGYMDLLAFYARGFLRVTATLGTALTVNQVRLLRRIADEVVLVYDGDAAGQKAMTRALPLFLQEQLRASCIVLPAGKDPDDFLGTEGLDAFRELLQERRDLGLFVIENQLAGWDGTIGDKSRVCKQLAPILKDARDPVLQDEYLRAAAERLGLSETVLHRQIYDSEPRKRSPRGRRSRVSTVDQCQVKPAEETIVKLLLQQPALVAELSGEGVIDQFEPSPYREIARTLIRRVDPRQPHIEARTLYDCLDDADCQQVFTRLLMDQDPSTDPETARLLLRDRLQSLRYKQLMRQRRELQKAMAEAEKNGDGAMVLELARRLQTLHTGWKSYQKGFTEDDTLGEMETHDR